MFKQLMSLKSRQIAQQCEWFHETIFWGIYFFLACFTDFGVIKAQTGLNLRVEQKNN